MSLSARALGGIGWSYLNVVGKALLTLLVLAVLSRLLTPGDFGLLGISWIVMDFGNRIGLTGIGHVIIQRSELTRCHIETAFALSVVIGGVIGAFVWISAPFFGLVFDEPIVKRLLQVLSAAFVIGGVGVVSGHLLRRNLRFKELMVADLLAYAVGYGLTATILAFHGFGVWALVWGELVRTLIYTVMVALYVPLRLRPLLAIREEAADLVFRGAGISLIQMFEFIIRAGGIFVVGRWLGATSLGYYTRADKLASIPLEYVGGSLFEVAFPAMAQRQRNINWLRDIYLYTIEMLSLLMLPVSVMIFVSAPEIAVVVLGEQWDATEIGRAHV